MAAQNLSIMHAQNSGFIGDGLRNCFEYRDLGLKEATAGGFHAYVSAPSKIRKRALSFTDITGLNSR